MTVPHAMIHVNTKVCASLAHGDTEAGWKHGPLKWTSQAQGVALRPESYELFGLVNHN